MTTFFYFLDFLAEKSILFAFNFAVYNCKADPFNKRLKTKLFKSLTLLVIFCAVKLHNCRDIILP